MMPMPIDVVPGIVHSVSHRVMMVMVSVVMMTVVRVNLSLY